MPCRVLVASHLLVKYTEIGMRPVATRIRFLNREQFLFRPVVCLKLEVGDRMVVAGFDVFRIALDLCSCLLQLRLEEMISVMGKLAHDQLREVAGDLAFFLAGVARVDARQQSGSLSDDPQQENHANVAPVEKFGHRCVDRSTNGTEALLIVQCY